MKKTGFLLRLLFLLSAPVFSPVGSTIVYARTALADLQVITPENVKDLRFLTSMGQGIYSGVLDLQPGGDLVASVTESGIALLDRTKGEQTAFIPVGFQVTALSISPDGQTLAVVYNVPTGKMVDNSTIGFNGPEYQRRVGLYSLADGKLKGEEIKDLQECAQSNIWQIAFTPDGNSLVFEKKYGDTNARSKKLFCVLSITTGKITNTMEIPANAESTISPDGRYVAVIPHDRDDQVSNAAIYETPTFHPAVDIQFPPVKWPAVSFTRRGIFVVRYFEGEVDASPHQVRFWSVPDGKSLLTLQEQERFTMPAFPGVTQTEPYDRIMSEDTSPDGEWVVTGSQNGKVKLWDAKTGQFEKELGVLSWTSHNLTGNPGGAQSSETNSYVNPVAFSSDGMSVMAAENLTTLGQSGQIHIYRMPDGKETAVFYGESVGDESIGMAFSPDSSKLMYGGFADGSAEVHNVSDGELVMRLAGHTGLVNQTRYSPDGNWIATASDDHTIRLWDAENGELVRILSGHTARVNQIAFSPDGRWLVSGADDNTIRRWQIDDGSLMDTLLLGDGNWRVEFLTVLADQHSVVYTAMSYPSPLTGYVTKQILWDAETGKETPVGGGKITISSIGQDGKTFNGYGDGVVVGNLDSDGKMTLIASGIRSPYGNGALSASVVSPDNRLLISGNGFGLQAWELTGSSASFLTSVAGGEPVPAYGYLIKISPDGKILALANGGVVYLMGVPLQ
ncbi:MAG: hypothetical protein AB9907_16470 [Flexilinea sp.]